MNKTSTVKPKLKHKFHRFLYSLFYRFVSGRETFLSKQLARIIRYDNMQQDRSDIPISEEAWEAQYQSGQWKYMADMNQLARYSIIISYMAYLRPGGAVLDVGCGDGVLFERFRPYGYSRYLGIDICGTALTKLIEEQYEKTLFIRADAETYTPDEQFDVIVLNEVVYYFHEPLKTVEKYVHALKKDGILVVSSFTGSERAMSILQKLKAAYSLLDESRIIHEASSKSWICSVFLPILQDE